MTAPRNIKHPQPWLSPEERNAVLQHYALPVALREKPHNESPEQGHKNSKKLNQTQFNLIEMASHSSISATSYGLNVKMGNQPLSCYTVDNPNLRVGLDRKIYFAAFINKQRIIACVDSGSDLTLMQENHFF